MTKDRNIYLYHMRDCAQDILAFTKGDFNLLYNDKLTKFAVERCFTIIGEASGKLPDELKLKYPQVKWQKIKAFRNHLTHEYFDIDYEKVWEIIENEIPILLDEIGKIITDIFGAESK